MRKIEVVDYTYESVKKYESEAEQLKEVFKMNCCLYIISGVPQSIASF